MAVHTPAKQDLVLVPGLLCGELLWQSQVAALSDLADCWIADHMRLETLAGVAAGLLRDAPFERFAVAGLAMRGYVGLEMVRQAKHRVLELALLDTCVRAAAPEQSKRRRDLISLAERGRFLGGHPHAAPDARSSRTPRGPAVSGH
jgi:pimeloyl-ACP methyl ester carboxylesterase